MTTDEFFTQPRTYTCPNCGTTYTRTDTGRWAYDGPGGITRTVRYDQLTGCHCCYVCAIARRNNDENRLRFVKEAGEKAAVISHALGTSAGSAITKREIFNSLEAVGDDLLADWICEYLRMDDHSDDYVNWLLARQQ